MTLVQLRHLIALADAASFSKAAQAAFVSQPALSRSIRALEDELKMPLVDRVGRRIEFTAFGRETLERARQLVFDADELRTRGSRIREGAGGTLRIGMGSGAGALLTTPLLMQAAAAYPRLRIEITRSPTPLLLQGLRARMLDALVVDARSLRPAPDLQADFIHEMRGAFMVRRGHPLLARKGPVKFDAVLRFPIASTPLSDEVARILVERYGQAAHPEQCVVLRCDELSSLIELAAKSDAVLLAVRGAAPRLVELTLRPALDASARFGLVTLARRAETPALRLVRELMERLMHD
jgi:DNA-binding transcriptional LysR family regulator